jgi:hypothetical protein
VAGTQRDLAPQDRAPSLSTFCSFGLLWLWPVIYGLGMRQPAHGCNVRAKRLTHWLLTNSRRLRPYCCLCQHDWLAITAADLRQTRPVCSPDESRSRRYSPRASRSMPEPPSKKIYTTKGGSDATRPLASLLHTRLHICAMCIYMRTNEQPTRHRACISES